VGVTPFLNILKLLRLDYRYRNVGTVVLHWSLCGMDLYKALQSKLEAIVLSSDDLSLHDVHETRRMRMNNVQLGVSLYNTSISAVEWSGVAGVGPWRSSRACRSTKAE
jgi:hypothetical protein